MIIVGPALAAEGFVDSHLYGTRIARAVGGESVTDTVTDVPADSTRSSWRTR